MASPDAHARLIVPRVSLASCVRAYITRSTVGVELAPQQRYNHFPATPTCTVCWFMQGSAWRPGASQPLPGPILFGGPHTGPSVSYNPGPVHGFMLIVMPDALRLMTGIDAGEYVNRVCAAQEVFDAEWQAMFDRVLHASDDATRVRCIEEFLDPRWQAVRGGGRWGSAGSYRDWAQSLAMRAAMSGLGRSMRQMERRVRAWCGLPMRSLQGLSRAEASFLLGLQAVQAEGELNWAALAAEAGYADQSHLCRESRRVTGFSPAELLRLMQEDERFWVYRVWR
jgi:AraC-like DNA-binding protein